MTPEQLMYLEQKLKDIKETAREISELSARTNSDIWVKSQKIKTLVRVVMMEVRL